MHRTDKYPQQSSIIWSVWSNGWVFIYELSGCGFESSCSHIKWLCGDFIGTQSDSVMSVCLTVCSIKFW